jgi:hypothetical protein
VPIDIFSILHMNRNKNKHAVIREKILRNHKLDLVKFVHTSLPIAFAWLGDEGDVGLSQLYGILRSIPHLIQNKGNKARGVKREGNQHGE